MNQSGEDARLRDHPLDGLDGGNPLAFLAALGTLRTLTLARPGSLTSMSWRHSGPWRPILHLDPPANRAEIVAILDDQLATMRGHDAWSLGPNLSVTPTEYRTYAERAASVARTTGDRTWADFACAFGSEATVMDSGVIQDTAFRTMNGAGHQHFLQFMATIVEKTGAAHLRKTLFEPWRYDDPVEKQTLRWDPADDVRRAFRWRDPSGDPARRRRGGMLGANRLAIEALTLMPTIPVGPVLKTTGFTTNRREGTTWTWPIWSPPVSLDIVRSLLARVAIRVDEPSVREILQALGIVEIFRARRLTIGKFRGFTPARPI